MILNIYQIDAFTSKVFGGNPAAVCILTEWLDDKFLPNIAAENNLSETAFCVKTDAGYHIRWFTPSVEVALCGHATLAAAFVIFNLLQHPGNTLHLSSEKMGPLLVKKEGKQFILNFPADAIKPIMPLPERTEVAMSASVLEAYAGESDLLLLVATEEEVKTLTVNQEELKAWPYRGIIVSAKGKDVDFVSRFFCPNLGIAEDPVTGSAHRTLAAYWSKKLNKSNLSAKQLSNRGGELQCRILPDDRVEISGQAIMYLKGEIYLDI